MQTISRTSTPSQTFLEWLKSLPIVHQVLVRGGWTGISNIRSKIHHHSFHSSIPTIYHSSSPYVTLLPLEKQPRILGVTFETHFTFSPLILSPELHYVSIFSTQASKRKTIITTYKSLIRSLFHLCRFHLVPQRLVIIDSETSNYLKLHPPHSHQLRLDDFRRSSTRGNYSFSRPWSAFPTLLPMSRQNSTT